MPDEADIRIWALLGSHRGDNNQVLALAEALGLPFERKQLSYNALRRLPTGWLGATFASVSRESRPQLEGEPPDLTISTGLRSVPVVRELVRRSGGKTHSVHLGFPRIAPRHFDLVVPTPEYPVPDAPNVMRIPFALSPPIQRSAPSQDSRLIEDFPSPRRLLLLGGPTLYWKVSQDRVTDAVESLLAGAANAGGSVLAIGSPRTEAALLSSVAKALSSATVPSLLAPVDGPPSYAAMMEAADEIYVTADSVAMTADAVMTGKPVGLIPIEQSGLGRFAMAVMDRMRPGQRLYPRDLRFFWDAIEQEGFAGTLVKPRSSSPPDYAQLVANRVRQLLALPRLPAKGGHGTDR